VAGQPELHLRSHCCGDPTGRRWCCVGPLERQTPGGARRAVVDGWAAELVER
jgi:hypothetical protein